MKVLGFHGSLRKESFNKKTLHAAIDLAPEGMAFDVFEGLGDIPLYNEDVKQRGFPDVVADLRKRVKAADAILFVTPEYNYSVPGVLKNAIDWVSRPPEPPFDGKKCAMMGASISKLGTARAQYHLRQICVYLNLFPLNRPEVMIADAEKSFDENGRLTNETARRLIRELLEALMKG